MRDGFAKCYFSALLLGIAISVGALAHLSACDPAEPPDMAADLGEQLPDLAPAGPACWACDYLPTDCGGVPSLCALQPSGQRCCVGAAPILCGTVLR